jgi:signal transduction histidine kinase
MAHNFSISLKNRLSLTYALFITIALGILILVVNYYVQSFFNALIKDNISKKSMDIARNMEEQFEAGRMRFNTASIEALGMYFVQEGYIITVEDEDGNEIWDARVCDYQHCMDVITDIETRMVGKIKSSGEMRKERYDMRYGNRNIGTVIIETYGPFFYSEAESAFLSAIRFILLMSGFFLIALSVVISVLLSRNIVKPILKAKEAAQSIAAAYDKTSSVIKKRERGIKIDDNYSTRELAELCGSINSLSEKLEEAERRQSQFTGDIAHELRTPLTCLQGTIEAMIDGVFKYDKEHLVSCNEEISRLTKLIDDMSTLNSLEWSEITLNKTEFDLVKLLNIIIAQWESEAAKKNIVLSMEGAVNEAAVFADYDRLKQAFINLVSNAVKYTDKGSITISVERENSEWWMISFADTGIGVPEKERSHIFERLYRTDKSRSRGTGGAGIGLAITAAIIAAHGGNIIVESGNEGDGEAVGSVFKVWLECC